VAWPNSAIAARPKGLAFDILAEATTILFAPVSLPAQ